MLLQLLLPEEDACTKFVSQNSSREGIYTDKCATRVKGQKSNDGQIQGSDR